MNAEPLPAPLIDRAALEQALRGDVRAVKAFREALKVANDQLGERFRRNESIETLVAERAHVVDEIILASWRHFARERARRRPISSPSAVTAAASCIRNPTSTLADPPRERVEQDATTRSAGS